MLKFTPLAFALVCTAVALLCGTTRSAAINVNIVGGASAYDQYGYFTNYYIFAEEGAPLNPAPTLEITSAMTGLPLKLIDIPAKVPANPRRNKVITYGKNLTRTLTHTLTKKKKFSRSETVPVPRYAFLQWFVRSAPFGSLSAVGPKQWFPDSNGRFTLTGLTFRTAGRYDVGFNLTTLFGTHIRFNRTITVQRQPTAISLTSVAAGFNGSSLDPAPSAQMLNFAGLSVFTPTVKVFLDFQVVPTGATVSGALTIYTTTKGAATFSSIVPSLPGTYTYRLVATLSDGSQLVTSSQRIVVQRALPVRINVLRGISGIARFQFYTMPLFSIDDAAGPSQDPRSNMTVWLSSNNPEFSYSGYNTQATLSGQLSVLPINYRYTFTDLWIDLPGSYQLTASLLLVTGVNLSTTINFVIENSPTYEVYTSIVVNTAGIVSVFGDRPVVSPLYIMLATDVSCTQQSSDQILWTSGTRGAPPDVPNANISVVPFRDTATYVCMKIPTQPNYVPLVQHYLQQFNEQTPLVYTFTVASVTTCQPLTDTQAAQYHVAGWLTANSGRRYGCALKPPASGTVPPCACPAVMTCNEQTDVKFTPPGLNIGQCVCCTTWVLALAGTLVALFFSGLMYTIFEWV